MADFERVLDVMILYEKDIYVAMENCYAQLRQSRDRNGPVLGGLQFRRHCHDQSGQASPAVFEAIYRQYAGARPERRDISESYIHAVREAAAGRPFEAVPIDLSNLSKFQRKVLKALQKIPAGEVRTYAWLARKAGQPNAARAVETQWRAIRSHPDSLPPGSSRRGRDRQLWHGQRDEARPADARRRARGRTVKFVEFVAAS